MQAWNNDSVASSPLLQPAERPEGVPDPYHVYLERLTTTESQRTMRSALDGIVLVVMAEEEAVPEERVHGDDRPWWLLRQADTACIRDLLITRYRESSPANVNKRLSALRGVLEECWNLGLMQDGDYLRASRELRNVPLGSRT